MTAITTLIQLLLSGECDAEQRPYLCGGRLVPLQKKLGGIRPLVVGELFKLLTGKVFMGLYGSMLGDALHKSQVSVRQRGMDEAVLTARS